MSMTLDEAKQLLRQELIKGIPCPCCGRYARMYPRKLNSNMVMFLIDLVRLSERGNWSWISYTSCRFTGRDYNYLPQWELATTTREGEKDKSHSGYWKPTQRGVDFVYARLSVDSHLWIYANESHGPTPNSKPIDVYAALGKKFSYAELMGHAIGT